MKALKLSQVASILALAFMASIVPACGGGSPGTPSLKAASFQATTSSSIIHQATAAGPYSVPVTTNAGGTAVPLKTWTFTPAPGEVVTRVVISGQNKWVYPGFGAGLNQQASIAITIMDGHGISVGSSPPVLLVLNTMYVPFYIDAALNLSGFRDPSVFPTTGPYTISLAAYTYPYWVGDFTNLQLEVYTTPFTTVTNSPQIN